MGALKNIYAIAAGMAHALGMGENTRSMVITRALTGMSRLAQSQRANPMRFLGLAGVGDLIATCSSPLSHNFRVGLALGQGMNLDKVVESLGRSRGHKHGLGDPCQGTEQNIYMPLATGLYSVMFNGVSVQEMARGLMHGNYTSDVEFVLSSGNTQRTFLTSKIIFLILDLRAVRSNYWYNSILPVCDVISYKISIKYPRSSLPSRRARALLL